MNTPPRTPEPKPKSQALATVAATALLWFCAIAVVLTVLVFGSCLLMLR
jgi:hypothetical protein